MSAQYITKDGDMLDELCWKHYGNTDAVELVINANHGFCELPEKLATGTLIEFPEVPKKSKEQTFNLWD